MTIPGIGVETLGNDLFLSLLQFPTLGRCFIAIPKRTAANFYVDMTQVSLPFNMPVNMVIPRPYQNFFRT
jgi:hypothetical protein